MYIQNKPLAAFYKLFIGAFALILEWFLLSEHGITALRLFPVWVLFLTATYFLSSSLIIALSSHEFRGKNLCPPLHGMIIMSFMLMGAIALASSNYSLYLPDLPTWIAWSIGLVFPILTLLDWLLFTKKGRWRVMMPFYSLALPVCYIATMIFTAEILPSGTTELLYPLELINFREFGLWPALQYLTVGAVVFLLFGYILYMVDFTMSGKLAKHVVLPHIRVVDVDENGEEIITENIPAKTSDVTPSAQSIKPAATATPSRQPAAKPTTPPIESITIQPTQSARSSAKESVKPKPTKVEITKITVGPSSDRKNTTVKIKQSKSSAAKPSSEAAPVKNNSAPAASQQQQKTQQSQNSSDQQKPSAKQEVPKSQTAQQSQQPLKSQKPKPQIRHHQ